MIKIVVCILIVVAFIYGSYYFKSTSIVPVTQSTPLTNTIFPSIKTYKEYSAKEFSFKYPEGWEIKDNTVVKHRQDFQLSIIDPNSYKKEFNRYHPDGMSVPTNYVKIHYLEDLTPGNEVFITDGVTLSTEITDQYQADGYSIKLHYYKITNTSSFHITNGKRVLRGNVSNLQKFSQNSDVAEIVKSIRF